MAFDVYMLCMYSYSRPVFSVMLLRSSSADGDDDDRRKSSRDRRTSRSDAGSKRGRRGADDDSGDESPASPARAATSTKSSKKKKSSKGAGDRSPPASDVSAAAVCVYVRPASDETPSWLAGCLWRRPLNTCVRVVRSCIIILLMDPPSSTLRL